MKPPGTKRLKLQCDEPLSDFAFKFNLRRYNQNPSQFPSPDPRVFEFKAYDGAAW